MPTCRTYARVVMAGLDPAIQARAAHIDDVLLRLSG